MVCDPVPSRTDPSYTEIRIGGGTEPRVDSAKIKLRAPSASIDDDVLIDKCEVAFIHRYR